MLRIAVVIVMLLFSQMGYAECTEGLPTMLTEQLHQARKIDESMAQCKIWPADPSKMIVVLLLPQGDSDPDQKTYDLDILVVKSDSGYVLSRFYQKGAVTEDAIRISGVEIDTGRYRLAEGMRAFGVRISHGGSTGPNPLEDKELSLYVMQGQKLSRVLTKLVTSSTRGAWDTNCTGTFSEVKRTLAIGTSGNHGYADLVLHEIVTRREARVRQGQCEEMTRAPVSRNYLLHFDGTAYSIPKELTYELN